MLWRYVRTAFSRPTTYRQETRPARMYFWLKGPPSTSMYSLFGKVVSGFFCPRVSMKI